METIKKSHNESHNRAKVLEFSASSKTLPHNPKVATEGFNFRGTTFERLYLVTRSEHYSSAYFKDGYRKKANITGFGNLIIFDIDNFFTIEEAKQALSGIAYLIVTTLSHTEKQHRFRVLIPQTHCLSLIDDEYYKEFMKTTAVFCGFKPAYLDDVCFNRDRQYAPNPKQLHYYNFDGKIIDTRVILKAVDKRLALAHEAPPEYKKNYTIKSGVYKSLSDMRKEIREFTTPEFTKELLEERGFNIKSNWQVVLKNNNSVAVRIDPKTGMVKDFSTDNWYDPVSLLYDHFKECSLPEATNYIYDRLRGNVG